MQTYSRRQFVAAASVMVASLAGDVAKPGAAGKPRIGLAAFSSHRHWNAARSKLPGVKFSDARGFFDHARSLGAAGVQAPLRGKDETFARELRAHVEKHAGDLPGYYEADISLPAEGGDWEAFETEVKHARVAGATVARSVLMGGRRYEVFKSVADVRAHRAAGLARLQKAEPIVRKHQLKLAIENHKDLTAAEQVALLKQIGSEWVGVTVDTGNNLALLEDPLATVDALAPFAMTVHLKDMAVQPHADGFRLSEVVFGSGFLDLRKIVATLQKAKPGIALNIEMATRDPLVVPCRTDRYWTTFEKRDEPAIAAAMERVKANPPKEPPPTVAGMTVEQQLAAEEENNRKCVAAMAR